MTYTLFFVSEKAKYFSRRGFAQGMDKRFFAGFRKPLICPTAKHPPLIHDCAHTVRAALSGGFLDAMLMACAGYPVENSSAIRAIPLSEDPRSTASNLIARRVGRSAAATTVSAVEG